MAETDTPPVPAAAEDVVTLQSVSVAYGKNYALRDVTAGFKPGAVGLLGPNGAGKSTMIKSLLGFIVPTAGQLRVLGMDVATSPLDIRARIGYLTEEHQIYGWMTVREAGRFQSAFYPRWNDKIFRGVIDHFGPASPSSGFSMKA